MICRRVLAQPLDYMVYSTSSRHSIWPHMCFRCHTLGRVAGLVFVTLAAAILPLASAESVEVRDIRIGIHPDSTRFVLDMSGEVQPRIFGLPDPYRVVIDLPETTFALANDKTNTGGGLVERMRYGLFRPGLSRLVLDLDRPAKVKRQFFMKPAGDGIWRLVIDLVGTDPADFTTTMRPVPGPRVAARSPATLREQGISNPRPVIVIDPGHGGVDPGALSPSGATEKTVALAFAKELRRQLQATGKYEVVLTRDSDVFMSLRDRVRAARNANADLFLSLHANTNDSKRLRGFSVYTLSNKASDEEAAAFAAAENKADVIGGVNLDQYDDDVASILIDFAQTKTNEQSVLFARDTLLSEVGKSTKLLTRPWRSAGFAVLKAPDVPSVLVELGYLTNQTEGQRLQEHSYQQSLSASIVTAVNNYFASRLAALGTSN